MAHLNIASLPKHIDELRLQLTKQPLDILSINETRLDDTINDGLIHLNGYDVLRKDRNRMGGGVAIYFRDFDTSDPNEMWESWKNIFNMVLEKHAPTRIRKVRSEYAPWLTSNIKKSMYHRDYLKKMAVKHIVILHIITKHLRHKGTKSTKL